LKEESKDKSEETNENSPEKLEVLGQWTYKGTNYSEIIERVLDNSDDIECTVISVFNLLITIVNNSKFNQKKFINLSKTFCFNFHKMLPVRL